jgi:hypothetical protein
VDIDREYQPGEQLAAHWLVTSRQNGAVADPREVELNASLAGPYPTIGDMKSTSSAAGVDHHVFAAEPVRAYGQAGERPVSMILIPSTAPPGFYKLTTSVTERGGSVSGVSAIRIVVGS